MSVSFAIILIAFAVLYIVLVFADPFIIKSKGQIGEELAEESLDRFEKYKYDIYGKTLRNVYIPKSNSGTSEIDVLYITARGIFVIESKNYSGWIFGKRYTDYWTATLPSRGKSIKNRFYNPIMQNEGHIKYLREYLKTIYPDKDFKIFSIVVFSDRCYLKSVPISETVPVIQRFELFRTVKRILEQEELSLTNVQVDTIYEELNKLTGVDESFKQAHVDSINSKRMTVTLLKCPRCGNDLVIRTAKKGKNVGKKFYGCSSFPKCRYTKNIEE